MESVKRDWEQEVLEHLSSALARIESAREVAAKVREAAGPEGGKAAYYSGGLDTLSIVLQDTVRNFTRKANE